VERIVNPLILGGSMEGRIPIITLQLESLQHHVTSHMAAHHAEVEEFITKGINAAIENLPEQIIKQAAEEASKQISNQIVFYFSYGEGSQAIKAAVQRMMEPIADALNKV
jgi:hypothetical protein